MLVFGVASAIAFCVAGLAVWWLVQRQPWAPGARVAVVAAALWVTGLATTWALRDGADGAAAVSQSGAALAWPVQAESPLVAETRSVAPRTAAAPVGSVESLVGGLEARLAANPADAEGWSLLAQSYAYTANEEALERAVRRAVELGVDEAMLRERVATAKRSAHAVDWVDRAVGGQGR